MDINTIFNPIITPIVIVGVVSAVLVVVVIKARVAIGRDLDRFRRGLFTRAGFFWTVNLVFMAVSVVHAGIFFGITGNGHDLPGMGQYLGFAVSFFLDLVTIILMQAMLEARYRGEEARSRQFLFFITVCCGTSTFANLAISLNDFDATAMLPHAPFWVQVAAPYVLASFPLFVIMMSIAAEMVVNVRPLESLNEEEYETDEKKRLRILEIRNTYLEKQANEELRALTIRAQMRANKQLRKGTMPNGLRWFWEKPLAVDTVIAGVTAQLKALYEPQIEDLKRRLEEVQTTGLTARLAAQNGRKTLANATDISWVFTDQNEMASAMNASPSAHGKPQDEYNDETQQPSSPIQMTSALFWITKNYPRVASEWLASNRKTATLEEITSVTGHTKRRLNKAPLRRSSRNPEMVLISSVIEWLKNAPLPGNTSSQNASIADGGLNDSLNQEQNGHFDQPKQTVNLDEYPEILV